ncbi:MAG: B12-binding domain-containing radical SAM protein [Sumerlaeia bacterium]
MHIGFITAYDVRNPYQVSLPPLGIGYLSAWVKQHCPHVTTSFHHTVDELVHAKPDLIAVSSTTENFTDATKIATEAKDRLNGVPVVLGGMHITSIPHMLPKVYDCGVVGEGENVFLDLVRLYDASPNRIPSELDLAKLNGICWHQNGRVVINPSSELIKNLDDLPYPDRETIDHGWKLDASDTIHLISSRGCPYKCSFCSSSLHWKRFRFFSPEYVAKEIEYLRERYNPEILYFFDDLFVGHIGRWRKVVQLFRERKIHEGVQFRAYARVDLLTDQMAEEFDELNFRFIDFGLESNSQKILNYLTKTRVTPEINQQALDLCFKHNISVGANFIIGSPDESTEDFNLTYKFAEENRIKIDRCSVGPLQPLPGTPIWNEAKSKGLVSDDMDFGYLGVTHDKFDFATFPFMCEKQTQEEFWDNWTKINWLAKEINYGGFMKRLQHQRRKSENHALELKRELDKLKGSRLIKAANWIRGLIRKDETIYIS